MTEKRKRRSFKTKKSIITLTLSMSVFLLAIIATTTFVLANQTQSVQSSITISYISQDVSGDMRLRAYYSGSWHNLTGTAQNGFIRLGQGDYTANNIGAANLNSVTLDKTNNYIVFECAFKNYGSHMVKVGFSETIGTEENITKVQKISRYELDSAEFNNISNETSAYNAVAVCGIDDDNYLDDYTYYYIKAYVPNLAKNATYQTTHSWTFTTADTVITKEIANRVADGGDGVSLNINCISGACLPILAYSNIPKPAAITSESTTGGVFNGVWSNGLGTSGGYAYNYIGEPLSEISDTKIYSGFNSKLTIANNVVTGVDTLTRPTYIVIPEGVTSIAGNAFAYDVNGTNVLNIIGIRLSKDISYIGTYALMTSNLKSLIVDPANPVFTSRGIDGSGAECNAVINKSTTELVVGCINTIIPQGVTKLYVGAFRYCAGLNSISIPNSVTQMADAAFASVGLKTIIFEPVSKLNKMGTSMFSAYERLSTIYFGGDETAWNNIDIPSSSAQSMSSATIYYYSATQPVTSGTHWHYDTDGVTPVVWE